MIQNQSGRFRGKSCVAYQIHLPALPEGEAADFLQEVAEAFLSFWEKESKKVRNEVHYGSLTYREKAGEYLFFAAFCPFSQRLFRPVFSLTVTEDAWDLRKITRRGSFDRQSP